MDRTTASGAASGVQVHYDSQAHKHTNLRDALAARRAGVLFTYKRYANSIKRQLIQSHARDARLLIDIGCGRGGDIAKWRDARVHHVVAMDLSAAQLDEARSRETDGRGGGGRAHTAIAWRQLSMLAPDFAEELEPEVARGGGGGGADAISAMFCVQFAFGSEAVASALLRQVSSLLRPGGVFFGTAPDADAVLTALGGSSSVTLQPPQVPFVLRLRLLEEAAAGRGEGGEGLGESDEFGRALFFSLEDTVTQDSDGLGDAHEYLTSRRQLARLADNHGLEALSLESMLRPAGGGGGGGGRGGLPELSEAEARVAGLYFTFAFRKRAVPDASSRRPPRREERREEGREEGRERERGEGEREGRLYGHVAFRASGREGAWRGRGEGRGDDDARVPRRRDWTRHSRSRSRSPPRRSPPRRSPPRERGWHPSDSRPAWERDGRPRHRPPWSQDRRSDDGRRGR